MTTIIEHEAEQVRRANATERQLGVFIHGLRLLPSSWRNKEVTEIVKIPNRGHALTIDGGWRTVAGTALAFVRRFA